MKADIGSLHRLAKGAIIQMALHGASTSCWTPPAGAAMHRFRR
ncbi:hypothetical protein [Xanthomonas sp.]|nr:hypothetical protein [Xanthomonas sp.]